MDQPKPGNQKIPLIIWTIAQRISSKVQIIIDIIGIIKYSMSYFYFYFSLIH